MTPLASAQTLAADNGQFGAGALGFLLVVVLIVATAGIVWAMSGSLKRMRRHVSQGEFGASDGKGRRGGAARGHRGGAGVEEGPVDPQPPVDRQS